MITDLVAAVARAPSADNAQPWSFEWNGTELSVRHRTTHARDPFGPAGHAVLLSIGQIVESIAMLAERAQSKAGFRWPADVAKGQPYVTVTNVLDWIPNARSLLPGIAQRHTNRFAYEQHPISSELVAHCRLAREGSARVVIFEDEENRSRLAEVARQCAEARFQSRELHAWLMESLRWTADEAARGDGLDVRTLGLPPGGRTFLRISSSWNVMRRLNQLGAYKALAAAEAKPLRKGPVIACVVGPDNVFGTIEAGRLLERTWVYLNSGNLGVHPFYVTTDQLLRLRTGRIPERCRADVANAIARLPINLDIKRGEILHMMLRVGLPTCSPVRSRRLPIEKLFIDRTSAEDR